jgi:hypothetical protein
VIRARIAFEREIASRWALAVIAWGLVLVTIVADPRWRDGWALFAAAVLPVLLGAAALRIGTGSDSWFRSLGGSPLGETSGRVAAQLLLVGAPLAVHASLAADVLRYSVVSVRFYALFVFVVYVSLLAGRALFPSLEAILGLSAVGVAVPLSSLLGAQIVGAWSPQNALLVRLAVLALPLAALAVHWDAQGTWSVQLGRVRPWFRGLAALAVAVVSLTALEAFEDGPLEDTSCRVARYGPALCLDFTVDRAWMVAAGDVRLLPDRNVAYVVLGPNGSYVAQIGTHSYDESRAVLHTPGGGILSLADGSDWAGFSPAGRWAARIQDRIAIIDLDGAMIPTGARDAAWLGEDLLVRRDFAFELWRSDGTIVELADALPAFTDPTLVDSWLLEANGWGRVRLRTQSGSLGRQLGFAATDLPAACARGPGCPGLLQAVDFHPKIDRVDPDAFYELPPSQLRRLVDWLRG